MLSGPNWSNAKHRSGHRPSTCSIRSSLASASGSVDSFQVFVRWKGALVGVQDLPQSLAVDDYRMVGIGGQVVSQLAQAPVRERPAHRPRPHRRDLDDKRLVVGGDPARPAMSPMRIQRGQPVGVERMQHVPDGVRVG